MGKTANFTQCRQCKYFVEDDDSLKNSIEYCILLGIHMDLSGNCPEFVAISEESLTIEKDSDPEPVS